MSETQIVPTERQDLKPASVLTAMSTILDTIGNDVSTFSVDKATAVFLLLKDAGLPLTVKHVDPHNAAPKESSGRIRRITNVESGTPIVWLDSLRTGIYIRDMQSVHITPPVPKLTAE
jgi:hypothetical protein